MYVCMRVSMLVAVCVRCVCVPFKSAWLADWDVRVGRHTQECGDDVSVCLCVVAMVGDRVRWAYRRRLCAASEVCVCVSRCV
mmetsp:Transcript_25120/g.72516  ORF Transcript_25120/g.72516 Transcript_25120/m.72516 type:complete len:82 (-) Transcript_25120:618-863(-)